MSNMSYCRFHNTLNDLRDCYENMEDPDKLNEDEMKARYSLIKLATAIALDYAWETGTDIEAVTGS